MLPSPGHADARHVLRKVFAAALVLGLVTGTTAGQATRSTERVSAPTNVTLPTISGTTIVGKTLTGNQGAASGELVASAFHGLDERARSTKVLVGDRTKSR